MVSALYKAWAPHGPCSTLSPSTCLHLALAIHKSNYLKASNELKRIERPVRTFPMCPRQSALTEASFSVAHSYVQIAAICKSGILCRVLLKRLNVVAVLFYYDYLLTFAAEVSHIWPQPISVNTFLFFLNRYFSFLGNIAASLLLYAKLGNPEQVR